MIFVVFIGIAIWAEQTGNPTFDEIGVSQIATQFSQEEHGGEGGEVRGGALQPLRRLDDGDILWGGEFHARFLYVAGGMSPLFLIQFGEVVFGGSGPGCMVCSIFVIIAVFVAGLMIGRMPDYLGKKIGPYEMKTVHDHHPHPHRHDTDRCGHRGHDSRGQVGGLQSRPAWVHRDPLRVQLRRQQQWQRLRRPCQQHAVLQHDPGPRHAHRPVPGMVLTLALAGSLASKKPVPVSPGTLPTHTPLFIFWLIGVVVLDRGAELFPYIGSRTDRRVPHTGGMRRGIRTTEPRRAAQTSGGGGARSSRGEAEGIPWLLGRGGQDLYHAGGCPASVEEGYGCGGRLRRVPWKEGDRRSA